MMKLLIALIALAIPFSAIAQNKGWTPEKSAGQMAGLWTKQCDLNAEQAAALEIILIEKQTEMFAAKSDLNGAELAAKTKEINRTYSKPIREAVGQENVKKMNAYWASRKK